MSLNEVMDRLKGPKAPELEVPQGIDPTIYTLYRRVWAVQKRIKCSHCRKAIDGICKRGEQRKLAKQYDLPCFDPNARLLTETDALIKEILKPL